MMRKRAADALWMFSQRCLLATVGPPSAMTSKAPPPLMKKHSQTDLVSRLKTRKVLGVGGEDDDGEVHRSKISQVLGNEMKFAVKEPLGLRVWIFLSALLFTVTGMTALLFPGQLYEVVFELSTTRNAIRLYGGALLSISLILWNGLYTAEKVILQWTLFTEAGSSAVQVVVTSVSLLDVGSVSGGALLLLLGEVVFLLITLLYYLQLGRRNRKL
ncbi:tumor protein p53-inducible protein 11-like isoform X2 [Denticeps clupeoides]|uniref:Tumor protein p53-inducible protein 11 n=1 Tax=Denticeps clupeoides TaxID=299321 RepID=A0AAY4C1M2_9TELE|nr:tumor protein p53-inducible protein 11-like isoform X2 [Denticeps clupeoides]XP_028821846.1 tumor protein p53-inducible protein 11-like isoform X2 [Denticeps clupeoides]